MKKKIALLLAMVMSVSMLAACAPKDGGNSPAPTGSGAGTPAEGGTVVVGLSYEPDIMDVYSTHMMGDVTATFIEGLAYPDENMEWQPWLATEIPTVDNGGIVLHDDNTMDVTWHLREGVKWHDGEPFTSADVKFTWEALCNPDWNAESKGDAAYVDSIDCPNDYTVVCHFNRQTPDFMQSLFTFGIFPKHICEGLDMNDPNNAYHLNPIGTGPFKFKEWKHGEYIEVVKNEDYWGEPAHLDSIVFRFITDENTRISQLKSGEIDFAYGLSFQNYEEYANVEGTTTITQSMNSWRYLDFNCEVPGLDDANVRHAISCAIDRQSIVDKLFNGIPTVWYQPWMSTDPYHVDGFVSEWAYDPEKAAQILDDAGWVLNADGVREKDGVTLDFEISCKTGSAVDEAIELVVIDALGKLGIKVTANNAAASTFTANMYEGKYELGCGGYITPPGATRSMMYSSTGALNRGHWYNDEFDKLSHQIDVEMDDAARKELVAQALEVFDEGLPQLVLFNNAEVIVMNSKLKGVNLNPSNFTHFMNAQTWYLEQ